MIMEELTGIFVVGFIVLGIYKIVELRAKQKERTLFLEKYFAHCKNQEASGSFQLPSVTFGNQDSGSWPLRTSLLMIGVGLGCLSSFLTTVWYEGYLSHSTRGFVSFAFIAIFGGIGLLVAYLIESKNQSKNK
jgi:hypothetical protein